MASHKNADSHHYSSLPLGPECSEGCGEHVVRREISKCKHWCGYLTLLTVGNLVVFLMTLTLCVYIYGAKETPHDGVLNPPIFDYLDLEPSIRRINGTVVAPEYPSIARQFPNDEADAQWEDDIDLIRPIAVTREQIIRMGKSPDTVAKLEDKDWGLGDNAYVAATTSCIRKLLQYLRYGPSYDFLSFSAVNLCILVDANNRSGREEGHLNHCVDILFQHISCGYVDYSPPTAPNLC
ncbi:tat pathway signal sequence [Cordyceps javanica]|nr:tat pathway signal sequence [Cordyceps javanica]